MPIIQSITRDEVCSVVLNTLLEHGRFPLHADMVDADPPIYIGEQIRVLGDSEFLVANIEFYVHASRDGTTSRVFTSAASAVAHFVRAVVSNQMYGVPVLEQTAAYPSCLPPRNAEPPSNQLADRSLPGLRWPLKAAG